MTHSEQLRSTLMHLHRRKNADYGNAWKKRGEVLSILANIARKVDRLEMVSGTQLIATRESLVDTLIDLVVYCVKYQTYLADHDAGVATEIGLTHSTRPFSDGVAGFEEALAQLQLTSFDTAPNGDAIPKVVQAFAALEAHFSEVQPRTSTVDRLGAVTTLLQAAIWALGQAAEADPDAWNGFVLSQE